MSNRLDYKNWKDFAQIGSYFLFALSFISAKSVLLYPILTINILFIGYCALRMLKHASDK